MSTIALRSALAETLEWALRIGGWLAFGELARSVFPLWAGGFGLLGLWLAIVAAASWLPLASTPSRRRWQLRSALIVAGLACGLAGLGDLRRAGPACLLAAGWAVALVAAGRLTAAMRRAPARPPSAGEAPAKLATPLAPAVLGTGLALAAAADPPTLLAVAWWAVPTAALALAALAPRRSLFVPADRTSPLHCVWPFGTGAISLAPAAWPAHCACLGMLPMMATLADTGGRCGGIAGLGVTGAVALHLAAMGLPALARPFAGRAIDGPSVVALAMLLGPLLLWAMPGARGLTALSLCQALAWGTAWAARASPAVVNEPVLALPWPVTLLPAAGVWAIGAAVAAQGPAAIVAVQLALAATATLGMAVHVGRGTAGRLGSLRRLCAPGPATSASSAVAPVSDAVALGSLGRQRQHPDLAAQRLDCRLRVDRTSRCCEPVSSRASARLLGGPTRTVQHEMSHHVDQVGRLALE